MPTNRAEQDRVRVQYAALKRRPLAALAGGCSEKRLRLDWTPSAIAVPAFTGARVLDVDLAELVPYIDWTFFFAAWELKGRFPAILEHPHYGHAARELFDNARTLLDRIVSERLIQARAVYGFWPANSDGDDVVVFDPGSGIGTRDLPCTELTRFPMLRQQEQMADGTPHLSLADFVAPVDSGHTDYLGAFAATAGLGAEALARPSSRSTTTTTPSWSRRWPIGWRKPAPNGCTSARGATGATALDEQLTQADLQAGALSRHSTAFGYPACPDHSEKRRLFDLLGAERAGIALTESFAMTPAASVSGLYFAHEGREVLQCRTARAGPGGRLRTTQRASVAEVERWLLPNLGYEP